MRCSLVTTCLGVERVVVVWADFLLAITTDIVGSRQPGKGREMLGSSTIVPFPGAEGEDWSNSLAIEILFLTFVKHNSINS